MTFENKLKRESIRKSMRNLRSKLSPEELMQAESKIFEKIVIHPLFKEKKLIGSYIGTNGEINTLKLNNYLKAKNHIVALPVIDMQEKGIMHFYSYENENMLIKNRYGILEPQPFPENLITPNLFEALLIPLLAFDKKGNRLGMGGGYYDRMLKKVSANCCLIGLAHDFQCVNEVPSETWDMPLDEIITPRQHFVFVKKY